MTTRTAPDYTPAIAAKAERLVAAGAVRLRRRHPDGSASYDVVGDTATHRVTIGPDGNPDLCDCPARRRCAHQAAAATTHRQGARPPMTTEHPAQQTLEAPDPATAATAPAPTKPAGPDPASGPAPGPGHDRTAANQVDPGDAEALEDAPPGAGIAMDAEPIEAEAVEAEALEDTDQADAVEIDADADYTPAPAITPAGAAEVDLATAAVTWRTLTALAQTEFVPAALAGRPGAVLGAVLLGREYGLGPLEALRQIAVIDGSPQPSAELQLRLYRRAGHRLEVHRADAEAVELTGTRRDTGDTMTVAYTLEDAERAGLVDRLDPTTGAPIARSRRNAPMPWELFTGDLLWARAVSRLVRRLAPDALDQPTHHHDQEVPR